VIRSDPSRFANLYCNRGITHRPEPGDITADHERRSDQIEGNQVVRICDGIKFQYNHGVGILAGVTTLVLMPEICIAARRKTPPTPRCCNRRRPWRLQASLRSKTTLL
jgi:hypothetical protein